MSLMPRLSLNDAAIRRRNPSFEFDIKLVKYIADHDDVKAEYINLIKKEIVRSDEKYLLDVQRDNKRLEQEFRIKQEKAQQEAVRDEIRFKEEIRIKQEQTRQEDARDEIRFKEEIRIKKEKADEELRIIKEKESIELQQKASGF